MDDDIMVMPPLSQQEVMCIDREKYDLTEAFLGEARRAWLTCPKSLFLHPKLRPMWAALDRLDGPITKQPDPDPARDD